MTNTPEIGSSECSRREFLGSSAKNAAGMAAGMVALRPSAATSSEGLNLAVVGVRNQGRKLATNFAQIPGIRIAAICDIDDSILASTSRDLEEQTGVRPEWLRDYRRLCDRSDIDAVVVATPDHWHTSMAENLLDAGKHLYLEQPLTRTQSELQRIEAAAERTECVVQTGLQQRSCPHIRSAMSFLQSGQLGRVALVRAWTAHRRKPLLPVADRTAPAGVDYTAWLGPAGTTEFNPHRFHYNWRWFWDYGSGELGEWGVHLLDVAVWGLQLGHPQRITASGMVSAPTSPQQTPDTLLVQYSYDDTLIEWEHRQWSHYGNEGRSAAVAFYGEQGMLIVDRGGWKVYHGANADGESGSCRLVDHCQDFLDSICDARVPTAALPHGVRATELCHLGNQAYRTGAVIECGSESSSSRTGVL